MKTLKKLTCLFLALTLVLALPVQALADTWDIANGDISIDTSGAQTVTQGQNAKADSAPVITGTSTENTVTITGGGTANVTIQDVNISPSGQESAITVTSGTTAEITVQGENNVTGGSWHAGVEVSKGATLTITEGSTGSLNATATDDFGGAGIGGSQGQMAGTININGGTVNATGSFGSAGIGGSAGFQGGTVNISGGNVTATGADSAAGIGGGRMAEGGTVNISGGNVTATGGISNTANISSGAGIGGGGVYSVNRGMEGGTTIITGGTVIATAGKNNSLDYSGTETQNIGGSGGLSTGESTVTITGGTVNGVCYDPKPAAPAGGAEEKVHKVSGSIWDQIHWELSNAEPGSEFIVDAGSHTWIPRTLIEKARSMDITLIIQWDGGEDITVTPTDTIDLTLWQIDLKELGK